MSIHEGSTPSKPVLKGSAGERELLLQALRTATARSKLVTNLFETIGVSLRHNQISSEEAMKWLSE
jgi:hypothetical protein